MGDRARRGAPDGACETLQRGLFAAETAGDNEPAGTIEFPGSRHVEDPAQPLRGEIESPAASAPGPRDRIAAEPQTTGTEPGDTSEEARGGLRGNPRAAESGGNRAGVYARNPRAAAGWHFWRRARSNR